MVLFLPYILWNHLYKEVKNAENEHLMLKMKFEKLKL